MVTQNLNVWIVPFWCHSTLRKKVSDWEKSVVLFFVVDGWLELSTVDGCDRNCAVQISFKFRSRKHQSCCRDSALFDIKSIWLIFTFLGKLKRAICRYNHISRWIETNPDQISIDYYAHIDKKNPISIFFSSPFASQAHPYVYIVIGFSSMYCSNMVSNFLFGDAFFELSRQTTELLG